jgi:probable HAF family extracellular repeat protein
LPLQVLARAILLPWLLTACGGSETGPVQPRPDDEGLQPTLFAAEPTSLSRGHEFDVRIFGSGFDPSAQVSFAVGGQVSSFLRVAETRFKSSTELVVVAEADADAPLQGFDIVVTDIRGRQGIGTELVEILNPFTVDLGDLGGTTSEALAINEFGQVVGVSTVPGGRRHAFRWTAALGMQDLGTLGASSSHANDVNGDGLVVGRIDYPGGDPRGLRAALWTGPDEGRELGTLGGRFSEAQAINDAGEIVGTSETAAGDVHAALWDADGVVDLGTLGGARSEARDINAAGVVVGESRDGAGVPRAFIWDAAGGMRELTTVGGDSSSAYAINAAGEVVGWRALSGRCQAFHLTVSGLRDLQRPADECSGIAFGIASDGDVVGESTSCCETAAIAWTVDGRMIALDNGRASDVNASGQVVGTGSGGATLWLIE